MIHNIQSLRAFAAISVVYYHIIWHTSHSSQNYSFYPTLLSKSGELGAFGVDIFFIISGFIMMHIQYKSPKSTLGFIKSRIIRIVPLYWLLTLTIFSLLIITPSSFTQQSANFYYLFSSLFFIQQQLNDQLPLIYVGWTLEWEMLFYILFAIALTTKRWVLGTIGISIVLLIIAIQEKQLLVIEFTFGMLLGFLYEKTNDINKFKTMGILSIITGLFLYAFWFLNSDYFIEWDRLFKWGIPALFLVAGALFAKQIHNKTIELLGDASYSIYLVQVFSIPVFYKLCKTLAPSLNGDLIAVLALIFSILAGVFTYLMIEKPMTNFLRTKLN